MAIILKLKIAVRELTKNNLCADCHVSRRRESFRDYDLPLLMCKVWLSCPHLQGMTSSPHVQGMSFLSTSPRYDLLSSCARYVFPGHISKVWPPLLMCKVCLSCPHLQGMTFLSSCARYVFPVHISKVWPLLMCKVWVSSSLLSLVIHRVQGKTLISSCARWDILYFYGAGMAFFSFCTG